MIVFAQGGCEIESLTQRHHEKVAYKDRSFDAS